MIAMDKLHSLHATYLTRKVVPKCEYCQKDFGITRLRHLCKRCNRIICSSCGSTRRTVVTFDMKTTHKVCPICEKEGHFQYTFKTLNQTKWGELSVVGEKWREKCTVKNENSNVVEETYAELVQIVENADSGFNDFGIIEKDVLQGRSDKEVFNYSMQEFLYYNQEGLNQKDIQLQIARVLKAFCMRHPSIGYCQGMNYMAVFLLSLMDEESAFLVLNHIVTRLLPQNFYTQTTQGSSLMGFHQEKFVLYSLAKERLDFDEAVGEKVRMFLDINGPGFLIPLFVNYLNFQVLFLIWNQVLLSQSVNEFRKITLYLIENLLERIKSDTLEKSSDLVNVIINMFTAETFELAQKIVIDDEKVHELEEQFKHEYSSKWISNDAYVYYTLQKYTHFKKNEILTLQEQYAKFVESNKEQGNSTFGVGEHQLKEIVALMITEDQKKLNYLDSLDFHSMFKIFDIDKTGYLDFKEFLSCLSMITRGNMFEKTECAFQIFDKDEKGYLTSTEYAEFVKSIIEASRVMVTVPDLQFDEDLEKLREKLLEISKRKDRVQYIDVRNALSSDDFVEFLDNNEQARQRGSTVAQIQKSLNVHSPKMEPSEAPIQEENEEELLEKE